MGDLTGFSWEIDIDHIVRATPVDPGVPYGHADLMRNDLAGFRVLGGGIDSKTVTQLAHSYTATAGALLSSFAAEAALHVVDQDLGGALEAARLLDRVGAADQGEDAIRQQLVALHRRLYGQTVAADSEEVSDAWALFDGALERSDEVSHAWKTTLTAMFQDIRMAHY